MLILLDSSKRKEAMPQDAIVTLFILFLEVVVVCLLNSF